MKAYKDLEALLGFTPLARKAIDDYAHALANLVREYGDKHITPELDDVVEELANHIDPYGED